MFLNSTIFESVPLLLLLPTTSTISSSSSSSSSTSPVWTNILTSFAMFCCYKVAIEVSCFLRKRNAIEQPNTRNVLQLFFSFSTVVFWPYFDTSCSWSSWVLPALLPIVVMGRLIYKGLLVGDATDVETQNYSMSGSSTELLFGPLLLAGVFVWLTLYRFMTDEAAIIMAASFGDGLAPLLKPFGLHHYQASPFSRVKTIEGSIGVFLGTVFACYFNLYMMGLSLLPLRIILVYGGIAAFSEAMSVTNLDNLITPIMLHLSIERVKELLPP